MATVAFHIHSNYDTSEREVQEVETGQRNPEVADPWLTEHAFGQNQRTANPPRFVPASTDYHPWKRGTQAPEEPRGIQAGNYDSDVAGWYRSLAREKEVDVGPDSTPFFKVASPPTESTYSTRKPVKRDKNSWFISRALESEPPPTPTPPPTLADILARDPPPEPTQQPFVPPVWLAIGPGNKGFAMLQKSGWEEGEALGRTAPRRARRRLGFSINDAFEDSRSSPCSKRPRPEVKHEMIEVLVGDDDGIQEVKKVDVIDLTSDTEGDGSETDLISDHPNCFSTSPEITTTNLLDHNPHALLTPLPTILKSNRLGIGLKAKQHGPYRESVKRVTHSQTAISSHVRANEQLRKQKVRVGRGARGFDTMKKEDREDRRNMLAYLNS